MPHADEVEAAIDARTDRQIKIGERFQGALDHLRTELRHVTSDDDNLPTTDQRFLEDALPNPGRLAGRDAHGPESLSELYRRACIRVKRRDQLALLLTVSVEQIPQESVVKSCG